MGKGGEKSNQDENVTLEYGPTKKDNFQETTVVYSKVSTSFLKHVVRCKSCL